MYQSLDLFQTAGAMARHAGARQATVARNIANADTPGFQAQSIAPFKDSYRAAQATQMRATRAGHFMDDASRASATRTQIATGTPSPNGNTVSLEEELLNSVAVAREHNRALTIYRHTMTVLRSSLGRG
jgi:flagellar basal-body rod protein FlgB